MPDPDIRERARTLLERHLQGLPAEALRALVDTLDIRNFEVHTTLVAEGDPSASMFLILEGTVSIVRRSGGELQQVAQLADGELFGEIGLLSGTPRLASVVAASRCTLAELRRERFEQVSARHPVLPERMYALYRERLVENVLRTNFLFSHLTSEHKRAVARAFLMRTIKEGEVLVHYGQKADGLYVLLRGRCQPFQTQGAGREVVYPDLCEGDVFGELSILLDKPSTASVRAVTPCTLLWFSRSEMEKLVASQPKLRAELMRMSFERLQKSAQLLTGRIARPNDWRV